MSRDSITRRAALKTGAGAAVLGVMAPTALAGETPVVVGSATQAPGLYEVLGINPVINAAGTITNWGGSLMPPEVTAAWQEASRHFVDLRTLQDRVGERIAERLGVEAAGPRTRGNPPGFACGLLRQPSQGERREPGGCRNA